MSFTLSDPVLRSVKGSPLTAAEEDSNFSSIRDFCNAVGQLFNSDGSIDPTLLQSVLSQFLATSFVSTSSGYLSPIGKALWLPKAMDPAILLPDNGTSYVRANGAKLLQADYPKLFAYLGHDFDADPNISTIVVHGASNTHVATAAVHAGGGGSGYAINDVLAVNGGTGHGANLKVTGVSGGAITSLAILNNCGDYTVSPSTPNAAVTFTGVGTGCNLDLTFFTGGGGTGYAINDVLTIAGGTGAPATVRVTGLNLTSVTAVVVVTLGNYTVAPSTPNSATGGTGLGVSLDLTFSSSVNPATEFRVPLLDGAFLFGADGQYPAGSGGGEKMHLLTAAESGLPDHTHAAFGQTTTGALTGPSNPIKDASGQTSGVTGGAQSASQSHNNLPPFRAGIFYLVAGYRVNGAWV